MIDDRSPMPRPRRLALLTLLLALLTFGLIARAFGGGWTPDGVAHTPVAFDAAFGFSGSIALTWVAVRLWRRHTRDPAALALALGTWAALAAGVTIRSALFAQADYERGRLPFFALMVLILLGAAVIAHLWHKRKTA